MNESNSDEKVIIVIKKSGSARVLKCSDRMIIDDRPGNQKPNWNGKKKTIEMMNWSGIEPRYEWLVEVKMKSDKLKWEQRKSREQMEVEGKRLEWGEVDPFKSYHEIYWTKKLNRTSTYETTKKPRSIRQVHIPI